MKIKSIKQKSIAGVGIELLWVLCFITVFGHPDGSIKGIAIWGLSLIGLLATTTIIGIYVR